MSDQEAGMMLPEGASDVTPTTEPKLTQLDDASRAILLNAIYKYKVQTDPESGALYKEIEDTKYPELVEALAYAASHLNSVMNYTWTQGKAEIMFFEGLFVDPLTLYYEDNMEALRILDALYMILRRSIIGGSISGTHQKYNVQMAGAHRTFEVKQSAG